MLNAALYRTRITHLRRAPVHHYFEHRGYSWYVDVDELPQLPRWLRPFARFDARDHFWTGAGRTTHCVNASTRSLPNDGIDLAGGRITALMQARVLGYVFNPLSLYWCHDADGVLRHIVAEVHNTYGGRHAYLLPPDGDRPAMVRKRLYVSPFNAVDGYYLVRAPEPGRRAGRADLAAPRQPAGVRRHPARHRRRAGIGEIAAPAARRAAGSAGRRVGNSCSGHHAVAARRPRRAAHRNRREGEGRRNCEHRSSREPSRRQSIPTAGRRWRKVPASPLAAFSAS